MAFERSVDATGARHLVLVGMMGAGKSTVGRVCAQRLARPFVDTDAAIEAASGRTVADIFATDGEPAFRAFEREAVAVACAASVPAVIACGGGAVLDEANRASMRTTGCVVWLRATPSTLADRIPADGARPLLADGDAVEVLTDLADRRGDVYSEAAHVTVDTDGLEPDAVADRVLEEYAACAE